MHTSQDTNLIPGRWLSVFITSSSWWLEPILPLHNPVTEILLEVSAALIPGHLAEHRQVSWGQMQSALNLARLNPVWKTMPSIKLSYPLDFLLSYLSYLYLASTPPSIWQSLTTQIMMCILSSAWQLLTQCDNACTECSLDQKCDLGECVCCILSVYFPQHSCQKYTPFSAFLHLNLGWTCNLSMLSSWARLH